MNIESKHKKNIQQEYTQIQTYCQGNKKTQCCNTFILSEITKANA